ncbi:hypothetical protein EXIGLDRAFT_722454 [Exidia glandulosa HHB12029]|uniref:Uncharacterized protein n=1 Tax=Exidia glandulosa HHB12029 TaxID=1314781 RepID=A0A166A5J0_EXIGL|nr:hypothetical protein EXIGLDRAFT_722454 [Exidia glandulosa HHB12029]
MTQKDVVPFFARLVNKEMQGDRHPDVHRRCFTLAQQSSTRTGNTVCLRSCCPSRVVPRRGRKPKPATKFEKQSLSHSGRLDPSSAHRRLQWRKRRSRHPTA